jgi:hypothetical protein
VALPTYGAGVDGSGQATSTGNKAGTAVSDTTTDNPTYNDLLAIWDAHNGAVTSTGIRGVPAGWQASRYWSATPSSASGHASLALNNGNVNNTGDVGSYYVALQVLNPATFTATSYERATDTFKLTGTDMSSLGQVGTDIKGFIDWTKFGYDTNADGVADVTFAQGDIASAKVTRDTGLTVVLGSVKATELEAAANFDTTSAAVGNADKLILATNAANTYSNAANVAVQQTLAGQATIDLGSDGKLILGVQVEGKWYYYWDRSGDGTSANSTAAGQTQINGGVDNTNHNTLDGIFKYDINGTLNPNAGTDTTETFRYATLNGVQVALPTYGAGVDGSGKATSTGDKAGTAVSDTTTDNPTYNDLLAIWDAHNGASTSTGDSGVPTGWPAGGYWSATPSASGHAAVNLYLASVYDVTDDRNLHVALQVL